MINTITQQKNTEKKVYLNIADLTTIKNPIIEFCLNLDRYDILTDKKYIDGVYIRLLNPLILEYGRFKELFKNVRIKQKAFKNYELNSLSFLK